MPALLGGLGAVLMGGGFYAFPWGTHSEDRLHVAILLWASGFVLWLIAAWVEWDRRGRQAKAVSGNAGNTGPQDQPPQVVLTDTPSAAVPPPTTPEFSHLVAQPTRKTGETGPALAQAREIVRQQLDAFRENGARISMAGTLDEVQGRGRPWQEEVIRYLSETFADPMPAVQFDQIDTPIAGQPPVVGLGQRIGEQLAYLGKLKDTLARYELKP